MNTLFVLLVGVLAALVGAAMGDLISEEIRGRLDQIPRSIVRLATLLLPSHIRVDLGEEWTAELHEILQGAEALPVTRLMRGIRYALGLLRAGRVISRELQRAHERTDDGAAPPFGPSPDVEAVSARALLAAADAGSQPAWDTLVTRYAGLVLSTARSFRLSDADTADVVQTTWLRLVEQLGTIHDDDTLASWLAITARRESLRLLRSRAETNTTRHTPPTR